MIPKLAPGRLLVVDACSLINLFASGRIDQILIDLPYRWAVPRYVAEVEILRVGSPSAESGNRLSRQDLERVGLEILDLESPQEFETFVRYATALDDGEASALALAAGRGGTVVTDDRKALSLMAREETGEILAVQTPEILFSWATHRSLRDGEIREILNAIQKHARFAPRASAPCAEWWHSRVGGVTSQ